MKAATAALGIALVATACAHGSGSSGTTTANAAATPAARTASGAPRNLPAGPAASGRPAVRHTVVNAPMHGTVAKRAAAVAVAAPAAAAAKPVVPQILAASVSPAVVGSGSVVRAVVRTTPGVVSVVAYAGGTSLAVPRVGPGLFAGSTTLPPLPPFARGSYSVTFVARDASGASTQSAVGVSVR